MSTTQRIGAALVAAGLALGGVLTVAPAAWAASAFTVEQFPGAPADGRVVALTFDDGPDPTWTPQVLDVLASRGVTATFFMVGRSAAAHPDLVRRVAAAGHAIGGHTWDHADLTRTRDFDGQVDRANDLLASLTGRPVTCVRPPYGASNASVVQRLADRGLTTALWSVDPQDFRRPGAATIAQRALAGLRPGAVILIHDGGGDRSQTVAALPQIIDGVRAAGYRIVPVCGAAPAEPRTERIELAAVGPASASGYALDSWGGLHAFGAATPVEPSTTWPGRYLARSLALRPDGASGFVLDAHGGLHPFGGAPAVVGSGYWPGQDVARALTLGADGASGAVVDLFGGVHPFGLPPAGG